MREAMRGARPDELPGGYWNASQDVAPPEFVENVLDFLRGGAPRANPEPPIRARTPPPQIAPTQDDAPQDDAPAPVSRAPASRDADGLMPPEDIPSAPPSRAGRRTPQAQRGEVEPGVFDRLFGR